MRKEDKRWAQKYCENGIWYEVWLFLLYTVFVCRSQMTLHTMHVDLHQDSHS